MNNIFEWNIEQMGQAIRKHKVSPVEITRAYIERIHEKDNQINAFITVMEEGALIAARKAETELLHGQDYGLMHGIPFAVKDLFYTVDAPTTMGAEIYKDFFPSYNATVLEKMYQAGAVLLGKLNTHQFAYGSTGDKSFFGPVHNPHNLKKISGGSSSGSAAAVAAKMVPVAFGTDTGGSIRMPSAMCGVTGMKPTFGSVSKYGVFNHCISMDHIGPITRSVVDNAIVLSLIVGYDENDPYSIKRQHEDFTAYMNLGIDGIRIGVADPDYYKGTDEEILNAFFQSIKLLEKAGAKIVQIEMPIPEQLLDAFNIKLRAEAYAGHKERLSKHPIGWDEEIKSRVLSGKDILAHEYLWAQEIKLKGQAMFRDLLKEVDVIVGPTLPILPTNINQRILMQDGSKKHVFMVLNRFTGPISLIGIPCMSVPCGRSNDGLPIGIQIMGNDYSEAMLYRVADTLEREVAYDFLS